MDRECMILFSVLEQAELIYAKMKNYGGGGGEGTNWVKEEGLKKFF